MKTESPTEIERRADEAARPARCGPPALTSLLLLGFLALSPTRAAAQGITGRVVDAESGAGVPSAQVELARQAIALEPITVTGRREDPRHAATFEGLNRPGCTGDPFT